MNKTGAITNSYTAKYAIGDSFWIMQKNEPIMITITYIQIEVTKTNILAKYITSNTCDIKELELDGMARTKEELMAKVFGVQR